MSQIISSPRRIFALIIVFALFLILLGGVILIYLKNNSNADIGVAKSASYNQIAAAQQIKHNLLKSNQIIVKFKNVSSEKIETIAENNKIIENSDESIPKLRTKVFDVPTNLDEKRVIQKLKATGLVEYAQVNQKVRFDYLPNDYNASDMWHHLKINDPTAWDDAKGSGVTIAILDTGVDCTHPDLSSSCISGYNFYDENSNTSDVHGHGTSVAGVAAAIGDNTANNSVAALGVAYKAKIIPLRISDTNGYAWNSDAADAIVWAADHGAKVVNLSFGFSEDSLVMEAGEYLKSKGGVLVISAGNDGREDNHLYSDDSVIVSATDSADQATSWSNYGVGVDVAAPGLNINTTYRGGQVLNSFSGTSASAPVTAGVLALMYSYKPTITSDHAFEVLTSTAKDLGDAGFDKHYGWGRIDAAAAINFLKNEGSDTQAPSAPNNLTGQASDNSVILNWTASTDNVGVDGYYIYQDGTKIASTTKTTYTDTSVVGGFYYTYVVKAYDSGRNISSSSNQIKVAISDTTPPSVPTNLTGSYRSNSIYLSWTESVDNSLVWYYNIYRNGNLVGYSLDTNYVDSTIESNKTYQYAVTAVDISENESSNISISISTTDTSPPTAPHLNKISLSKDKKKFIISWTQSKDNVEVYQYILYRDGRKMISYPSKITKVTTTTKNKTAGKKYTYKIRAVDKAGNVSAASNAQKITISK